MNMKNSRLPEKTLTNMLKAEVETSPEILESLSRSGSWYVRSAVAGNIHTSFETLARLTQSRLEEVRVKAKGTLRQKKILSKLESMMIEHVPVEEIINIFAQEVRVYNLEQFRNNLKKMGYQESEIEEGIEKYIKSCVSKISDRTVAVYNENSSIVNNIIGQLKVLEYPVENIVKVLRRVGHKRHKQILRSYSDRWIFCLLRRHYGDEVFSELIECGLTSS